MKCYEFYFSCDLCGTSETSYYAFSDYWTEEDISDFFDEKLEEYANRYSRLADYPSPARYEYEEDYEAACEEIYLAWLDEIHSYSSFGECDAEEWEAHNGELIL